MMPRSTNIFQSKTFRRLMAVLLAVILLYVDVVENISRLYAGEQAQPVQVEEPYVQEEPAPMAPLVPIEPVEPVTPATQAPAATAEPAAPATQAPAATAEPAAPATQAPEPTAQATQPPVTAEPTALPEDLATPEGTEAPEATEAPVPEVNPIVQEIAQYGAAYVRLERVALYKNSTMKPTDLMGEIREGIALATAYQEETEELGAVVTLVFATEQGMAEGFVYADVAQVVGHDEALEEIGEDAPYQHQGPEWPLFPLAYLPAEKETEEENEPSDLAAEPELPEQALRIIGFVGYDDPTQPLETVEVEEEETTLANVELPKALAVLLSDGSTVDLPVAWVPAEVAVDLYTEAAKGMQEVDAAEDAEVAEPAGEAAQPELMIENPSLSKESDAMADAAAAALEIPIAAGEALRVMPAWDMAAFALSEGVDVPFITVLGAITPFSGGEELDIRSSTLSETQTTYDLQADTQKQFEVRYLPTSVGTNHTLLVVSALEYGAKFTALPVSNNAVHSAVILPAPNNHVMVIRLQDGVTEDVTIDFKMEPRALTNEQATLWLDSGALPATRLAVRAVTGTLNTANASYTETATLATKTYGEMVPAAYATLPVELQYAYTMTVPSVGPLTNDALAISNYQHNVNYYHSYVLGNRPYYTFTNSTPHTNSTPLIEYTGIKVYAPSPKLQLTGVSGSVIYYPFTSNTSWANWVVGPPQTENGNTYYIIRPPSWSRFINNGTDDTLGTTLISGIRLIWQLKDVSDELAYDAAAYTTFTAPAKTQLLYKVAGNATEQGFAVAGPEIKTFARATADDFTIAPAYERQKSISDDNYSLRPGTTYNMAASFTSTSYTNHFVAIRNNYYTSTVNSVKKEWVPSFTGGPIVETYDFPYEIRPTNITFSSGTFADPYSLSVGKQTTLTSIVYTLKNGEKITVPAEDIAKVNTYLQTKTTYAISQTVPAVAFTGATAENYVTNVTVTWAKIVTTYYNTLYYYNYRLAPGTASQASNWWYYYARFEEGTRFSYSTTTKHESGADIVNGEQVQVRYDATVNGNSVKNFKDENYLWFRFYIPTVSQLCPELYTGYYSSNISNASYSVWADGDMDYTVGNLLLTMTTSETQSRLTTLENPVINVVANCKTSYPITNMTNEQALGFLSGIFQTSRTLAGWKITYSTSKPGRENQVIDIVAGSGTYQDIDLGIDFANGEYLTKLVFSYDGTYTIPSGTAHYLMYYFKMHAWNKNFVTGGPLEYSGGTYGRFYVYIDGTAAWNNCLASCGKHDVNKNGPQNASVSSYRPGAYFYLFREASLSFSAPSVTEENYGASTKNMESIYQGGITNSEKYASFTYGFNTLYGSMKPSYLAFEYYNYNPPNFTSGNIGYVPWGISEEVFVELTDSEFLFNPATTSLFGVSVGPYLSWEIIPVGGSRFLKLKLAAGYRRNTAYFTADEQVYYSLGGTTSFNRIGGDLRVGFSTVPGTSLGLHKPLGRVYFDFSQLLADYAVPPAASSKDRRTQWVLANPVSDELGLSSNSVTGNKLWKHDLSAYTVEVLKAATLSVTLTPGVNGTFDFSDRTVRYNSSNLNQLEALVSLTGSSDYTVYDVNTYVTIPRKDVARSYRDDNGLLQSKTSQHDLYLRGAPEVKADSTNIAGNLTFAYTADPNPSAASSYTATAPTTPQEWAAVTGIWITANEIPKASAINMVLPLAAPDKSKLGELYSYIGGEYNYRSSKEPSYSALLRLGTYIYEDLTLTQPYGRVFFDVYDENGVQHTSTSYERYATNGEVTVKLYDTDGVTLIDTATTDANGEFVLKTYKQEAGQIVEIDMPTTGGGTYKLTSKSVNPISTAINDSDFDRTTQRVTLPAVPNTGIANLSAGFVRLPVINAPAVSVQVNQSASFTTRMYEYLGGNLAGNDFYNLTFSGAADAGIVTVAYGQTLPYTYITTGTVSETTGVPVSITFRGLKPGETTATVRTNNKLGDEVLVRYNITVTMPKIAVSATKVWADSGFNTLYRPSSIKLQLYRQVGALGTPEKVGGVQTFTGSTTTMANWACALGSHDQYDSEGQLYTYTVQEEDVDSNYTATYNGLTVTNTFRTISITGKKVWDIRGTGYTTPTSIIVDLYRSDNTVTPQGNQTVSAATSWAFTFANLPQYPKGSATPYTYTVKERTVPNGMEMTVDNETYTITNTYPEDKEISVKVVWDHDGAPQATRTAAEGNTLTITLWKNGVAMNPSRTASVHAGTAWKGKINVPVLEYAGGTFTITQSAVSGYATTYSKDSDGTLVATNTYIMPTVTVSGTKTWVDTPAGLAKPDVEIYLYANGVQQMETRTIKTPAANNSATYAFKDLPMYDIDGYTISYDVSEGNVPGYHSSGAMGYNFINTYAPKSTNIEAKASKAVTPNVGAPDELFTFELKAQNASNPMPGGSAGGIKSVQAKANAFDGFGQITYTYPGMYTYTITETAGNTEGFAYDHTVYTLTVTVTDNGQGVLGAVAAYSVGAAPKSGAAFFNTYVIPVRTISGTLTWADNSDALGGRPGSATVKLYRMAAGIKEAVPGASIPATVVPGDVWTYSFTNQPLHDTSGNVYAYSVEQVGVDKNYTATVAGNGLDITDTLHTITVNGEKVWDIIGTEFVKPASVGIELYRDGAAYRNQSVSGAAGDARWPFAFANLLAYDQQGNAYTYEVRETTVPAGIVMTQTGNEITNTYPADKEISVRVVWDHTGAPQATRAAAEGNTLTITLQKNGGGMSPSRTASVHAGNAWQGKINVPVLEYAGGTFTITQSAVSGYATTYSKDSDGTLVAKNTYIMPTVTVSGTKTWVDTPAGLAKPDVEIYLYANGVQQMETRTIKTPAANNSATYAFKDLPMYDIDGYTISYDVSEGNVPGYHSSGAMGYNFINTYAPKSANIEAKASKAVTPNVGAPDELFTFELKAQNASNPMPGGSAGGIKSVQAKANAFDGFGQITYTYPGTYTYTITETAGNTEGFAYDHTVYTLTVTVTDNGQGVLGAVAAYSVGAAPKSGAAFFNTYVIPVRTISGTLTWADNSDALGGRPGSATVKLYRTAAGIKEAVPGASIPATVVAGDAWTYSFTNQPLHDTSGNVYAYSVEQVGVDKNYTATVAGNGLDITDTLNTISVNGEKVWDIIGTEFVKPASVGIELYRDGAAYRNQSVSGAAGDARWPFAFANLLAYDQQGNAYTYEVRETTVPAGIVMTQTGNEITNTYPADKEISVKVVWDHTGAPQATRAAAESNTLTMTLQKNGGGMNPSRTASVDAPSWQGKINVPVLEYAGGTFTIIQSAVSEYTTTYSEDSDGTLVATNTYIMPKVTVSGTKTWVGSPNGPKPTVEIKLLQGPTEIRSTTIQDGSNTYSFTGLDKYDPQGIEYAYTVTETNVPGYTSTQNGTDFTNTYDPTVAEVSVLGTKNVTQGVGAPAEQFTFTLKADAPNNPMPSGSVGGVKTLQAPEGAVNFGNITYNFPGTYTYTMKETAGSTEGFAYDSGVHTLTVTVTDNGDGTLTAVPAYRAGGISEPGFVFSNTYVIPVRTISGTLTWADHSDDLGGRPGSATVQLYRTAAGIKEAVPGAATLATVVPGDTWTYSFTNQPLHDTSGNAYTYSVEQVGVDKNYTATIAPNGLDITDTLNTIQVDGEKVWAIIGNGFTKPASVDITLYRNNTVYREQPVSGAAGDAQWPFTFADLLAYDQQGKEYKYTVQEKTALFAIDTAVSGTTITNTYAADAVIQVKVVWDHTGAPASDQPTSSVINLLRNGGITPYLSKALDAGGFWQHTFAVPQVDFQNASFDLTQDNVPGYSTVRSMEQGVWVFTNTYIMPKVTVSGTKTWVGSPSGVKPTVEINLLQDGAKIKSATIADGSNDYSFTGLDRYTPQGAPYGYTVTETEVPGYDTAQNGTDFTNTYNPQGAQIGVVGTKEVTQGVGAPAEQFTFTLTAGHAQNPMPAGSVGGTKAVQAPEGAINFGNIAFTFPGTYTYTIAEAVGSTEGFGYDATGYTLKVTVTDNGDGTLSAATAYTVGSQSRSELRFHNLYTVPARDIDVAIHWVDNDNALDLRPGSVNLRLYRMIQGGAWAEVPGTGVTVNRNGTGNAWSHVYVDMPVHDNDGNPYTYSVREEALDANYSGVAAGLTITNTLKKAGVSVHKTASPQPEKSGTVPVIAIGDQITYKIAVTNTGDRTVYNVRVMDMLPAGLGFVSYAPAAEEFLVDWANNITLVWNLPQILQGETKIIEVTVVVDQQVGNVLANTAYYRVAETDSEPLLTRPYYPDDPNDPSKPYIPTEKPVQHQFATLHMSANPGGGTALDGTALVEGQVVTYTLALHTEEAASGVRVEDVLPVGMCIVPGSITTTGGTNGVYDATNRTVIWPKQDIPANGVTMTFQAMVEKFTAAQIAQGDMSMLLENKATASFEHTDGAPTSTVDSNTLQHRATRREVEITKKQAALVEGMTLHPYETGSATNIVETELGQILQYKLEVSSKGYLPRGTVVIEDPLHADVAFVAGSLQILPPAMASKVQLTQAPGATNGNKAVWTVNGLGEDEGFTILFRVTAPTTSDDVQTPNVYETCKVFTNSAQVTDNGLKNLTFAAQGGAVYAQVGDYQKQSNTTYHAVYESTVVATKSSSPASPLANGDVVVLRAGDLITYTIDVENTGNDDAINVRVMDTLPAGTEYVSSSLGTPVVIAENGNTTLMWQIPKLDHVDRQTQQVLGKATLMFTVRVLATTQARLLDNKAYYRLPLTPNESFPAVPGKADDASTYRATRERVQHQVYTLTTSASPAGGTSASDAKMVQPGDAITYTLTLHAAANIRDVRVTDMVPEGMSLAAGSIQVLYPDGRTETVPDTWYDESTRTLRWPATEATAGETRFTFTVVVDALDGDMDKVYENAAGMTLSDGRGQTLYAQGDAQYHKTNVGYSFVTKTAALIKNGVALPADRGSIENPVLAERGKQVQYTLTVTRKGAAENRSGQLIITDALPQGMRLVDGSMQGHVQGGQGQLVSMQAKQVLDVDGKAKPGVEWVLSGMADGETATLSFCASLPTVVDDPATPAVETEKMFVNTARLEDVALSRMTYARTTKEHAAGSQVYGVDAYRKATESTYHKILGPALHVVLTSNVPEGQRVYGNDVITYTIAVTNIGAATAEWALIKHPIPAFMRYVERSATSDALGTAIEMLGSAITWIIPEIGVGQTVFLTFEVRVIGIDTIGIHTYDNTTQYREASSAGNAKQELQQSAGFMASNVVKHYQSIGATIQVNKVDAVTGARLAGAEFTLKQLSAADPEGEIYEMTAVSNGDGEAFFYDIPIGKYTVGESKAPEGYVASEIIRSVNIDGTKALRRLTISNKPLAQQVPDVNMLAGVRNVGDCPR